MEEISYSSSIDLLSNLIKTPSYSGEEEKTATIIKDWLRKFNINANQFKNNIWVTNKFFDVNKPTILLNSHHDTVKPNEGYTTNPFEPTVIDGKLYGLGSNDAGASLVSLMHLFIHFYEMKNLKYNLLFSATAEEEISGANGIACLLDEIPPIDFAVVGEPTEMHLAVAEKGLLVLDCFSNGISGHAAHENTDNAIYHALDDINWIRDYTFPKTSELLGKVKMSVTQINAGSQHNVVPAGCHFVVDVRVNECYQNKEVFDIINKNTKSRVEARSFKLNSSFINIDHPIVIAGKSLGRKIIGSSTISDQALLKCPSIKMGPGKSSRSHTANEFVELKEIEEGIELYIKIFNQLLK